MKLNSLAPAAAQRLLNRLILALLLLWFVVSFGFIFFAPYLQKVYFFGWPFLFYLASQGALFVYLFIVVLYALASSWLERRADSIKQGD